METESLSRPVRRPPHPAATVLPAGQLLLHPRRVRPPRPRCSWRRRPAATPWLRSEALQATGVGASSMTCYIVREGERGEQRSDRECGIQHVAYGPAASLSVPPHLPRYRRRLQAPPSREQLPPGGWSSCAMPFLRTKHWPRNGKSSSRSTARDAGFNPIGPAHITMQPYLLTLSLPIELVAHITLWRPSELTTTATTELHKMAMIQNFLFVKLLLAREEEEEGQGL